MSQTLDLKIKYTPHQGQHDFHNSNARFRILACGRRWGKTKSGANETIKQCIQSGSNAVIFCVAPTYWHTQKQWREFLLYCPQEIITDINRADRCITLIGNRLVWFKSADNPDSLRSEGLNFLWMDEGAQIKEDAWVLALRPALMDKLGNAIFTGTPKGKNWYFQLWSRGQDHEQADYQSWTYPSQNNPYLDPNEIAEFARDMPEKAYQQEILAMFIEETGRVFRNIGACISGTLEAPDPANSYVMGVDLAKHQDFTVLCVVDDNGHVCAWDRFSQLNWVLQRKRLINLANQYNARVLIDSTGVGDPIYDELRRERVRVDGYKFTQASKADLIENLSIKLENRAISYPNIPELLSELEIFTYEETRGSYRYSAPDGYYDDCVIALALAAWQLNVPKPWVATVEW